MRRILLIEDHNGARQRLTEVLSRAFEVVDTQSATTLASARLLLRQGPFDLIVLDLNLPDGSGEDFLAEILARDPDAYVVIATIHDEGARLASALANGAKGYLLKDRSIEELTENFIGIKDGRPAITPAMTQRLIELMNQKTLQETMSAPNAVREVEISPNILTEREREVLVLLSRGFSRPEIAGFLEISRHTVATHIGKIYDKLEVSSRSEAAIYAERSGLV